MVITLQGLDKYKSNNKGYGQTEKQTRTKVHTGKIYEFIQPNIITPGVTKQRKLMTRVSRNVRHSFHESLLIRSDTH